MRLVLSFVFALGMAVGLGAGCSDNSHECCDHHARHDDADIKVDAPYARVRVNIPDNDDDDVDVDVDVDD
ncbi:MAG TPA: hypothetical protein VJZ71_04080 [Phycisphaerae bacterium]|nr:hypothetical protein [Phycisphaerae bacterium]